MQTLLVADHDDVSVLETTTRALTAAKAIGGSVHILVAGHACGTAAADVALFGDVDKVILADHELYAHQRAEPTADLIVSLAKDYDAIVAPATTGGKNVMPRVAALLDVMQVSEVTCVIAHDTFEHPIYAGNAV